ncbi:66e95fbc-ff91-4f8d-aa97-3cf2b55d50cf [Thermothielavioides terrestris]|uniref:66e95fbc-ff91-4f8d-aa97-3cf2b55d50cf n=1 Tax=Thermothielavioides terrestris TaxID=2587410 RepID=A0A3S4F6K6_9PEZI|nr:66e95fbc-ff91-4f8d-aa97-3cf2b55d50cf [Thermothielavioides terrestris]
MDPPSGATGAASQTQSRSRKRQRSARASEAGNAATSGPLTPVAQAPQGWGAATVTNSHGQAVRAPVDTVPTQQPPSFPSQQLDRSHQVAEPDGLMNGYTAAPPQHTQYPDPQPTLAPAPQPDTSGLSSLSALAGDHHQHHQHAQPGQPHHQAQQQQQRGAASKAERIIFQHQYGPGHPAGNSSPTSVANSSSAATGYNLPAWPVPDASPASQQQPPPPEGIYRSFEDLLASVQRTAKEQGYSIVKLRASNYREGKPTRYDLVCDRGGVKYSSTAKKRNPSTRKVDCPWRAKAVCEVNLGHQWRFAVQEARHNHEARIPAAVPGQENTPVAQSLRSIINKVDRMAHEMAQGINRLEGALSARLDNIEKRLEALEGGRPAMLGGNGVPSMGATSMPPANMGGGGLGNGSLPNGGMQPLVDGRLSGVEGRLGQMEPRSLDGLQMMDDDTRGLSMMVNS